MQPGTRIRKKREGKFLESPLIHTVTKNNKLHENMEVDDRLDVQEMKITQSKLPKYTQKKNFIGKTLMFCVLT